MKANDTRCVLFLFVAQKIVLRFLILKLTELLMEYFIIILSIVLINSSLLQKTWGIS